ncbi:MAG: DUF5011 domain-containing protein [Erysipelotrichaceae bacterium]|nr:DUF5011 domain-containing protein [Erysipelotrichaceae bacterium]
MILFLALVLVTGCTGKKNTHTVTFTDDIQIEYGSQVNTAEYVVKIDSFVITPARIADNEINVSNLTMKCPEIEYKKLGKIKLEYKIGKEVYETDATVVDTVAPEIELEKDELTFEVNQIKDLDAYYFVKDNYDDKKDIKIEIDGEVYPEKEGEYDLKIKAKDTSGNSSKKSLKIVIKDSEAEKKKEEERKKQEQVEQKKEDKNNTEKSNTVPAQPNNRPSSTPSAPQQSNGSNVQTPSSHPTSRDYLFSEGYDMSTAPSACAAALRGSGRSGNCDPIQDASGIYIGMRLTLY